MLPESFGCLVFDDRAMKARLHPKIYASLHRTIQQGTALDPALADEVAAAMKCWALERGATHYTHWFQPLTGITAEKHDSFITPAPDGGVILEFTGKELIRGEPDASSFPSGGLRATFEARGYTAWDPTSYAFIKGKTLCIPSAFCAYGGQALDQKTPLLRSMQALNQQAMRILRLFGNTAVQCVRSCTGAEQEYFLIPKALYDRRMDLQFTGRTLFGARPPKTQEMEDHYFGAFKPKVAAFMADLNQELWKLGILAKTEHNEVAPCQHELAPIYTTTNMAADHNQLTMQMLQAVATRHGLVCLLGEKPFAHVNGSGKHNNWSLATDTGINLLSPGETPHENAQFLLFLCAVIQAVDDYQDLLRISAATAGNDHRLGGNEAPPAIVSLFLGEELMRILEAIEGEKPYEGIEKSSIRLGVAVLPRLSRDTTDRNRTAPMAFTGNKFEFRMLGAPSSIADANTMLNGAVAESLRIFADSLEGAADLENALQELIRSTIRQHKRILFNGNSYGEEWIREARRRGLHNYVRTPACIDHLLDPQNVQMLVRHGIFSEAELQARREVSLEQYCNTVRIEANTMIAMARRQILPAVSGYCGELVRRKDVPGNYERKLLKQLSDLADRIDEETEALEHLVFRMQSLSAAQGCALGASVQASMEALRSAVDIAEVWMPRHLWPFPAYDQLLFGL